MPDATSFPQLPSTVWTGVWRILHDSPSRRLDENVLSAELNVQKTAAKQYLNELVRLGLLSGDGTATDLAKRWRQDGDDVDATAAILAHAYPQELRELAPADRLDRSKIVRYFMGQGLGSGAANNKAATYIRIASGISASAPKANDSSTRGGAKGASAAGRTKASKRTSDDSSAEVNETGSVDAGSGSGRSGNSRDSRMPELAVNVQIHISADSTPEQIDSIFSAMRRYLDGDVAS